MLAAIRLCAERTEDDQDDGKGKEREERGRGWSSRVKEVVRRALRRELDDVDFGAASSAQ